MRKSLSAAIAIPVVTIFLLTSCVTIPEEHKGAATGAGIGALGGAAAGAIFGGNTRSTVIGGLLGALVGGAIGHYGFDQKKTRDQTQQTYNYQPAYGNVLTLEQASASPLTARPGDTVELTMTYAILTPNPNTASNITETRTITHNGQLVGRPEVRTSRTDGTYTSTIPLLLPADAPRGTYNVTSTVESDTGKDTKEFTFSVI